jgi:hypothetical protein
MSNVTIYMPDELHEQIRETAQKEHRSVSSMVQVLIWEAIDARYPVVPTAQPPKKRPVRAK